VQRGLIYQVAWGKRPWGLIFGHTVYADRHRDRCLLLAGLAAGSAFIGLWSEHRPEPVRLVMRGIEFSGRRDRKPSHSAGLAGVRSLYVAVYPSVSGLQPLLLTPEILRRNRGAVHSDLLSWGGTLPILVRGITRNSAELGMRVSQLYWVNTLGAVVGALISGFCPASRIGLACDRCLRRGP